MKKILVYWWNGLYGSAHCSGIDQCGFWTYYRWQSVKFEHPCTWWYQEDNRSGACLWEYWLQGLRQYGQVVPEVWEHRGHYWFRMTSKAVGESVKYPLLYYRNNIVSLLNLLELMQKFNVPNIVFSSSCTVYGQQTICQWQSSLYQRATSPYGYTKQMGKPSSVMRCMPMKRYIPFCSVILILLELIRLPRLGTAQWVPNNLLPYVTQTAMGIREKLRVFGNDYNTLMELAYETTYMLLIG